MGQVYERFYRPSSETIASGVSPDWHTGSLKVVATTGNFTLPAAANVFPGHNFVVYYVKGDVSHQLTFDASYSYSDFELAAINVGPTSYEYLLKCTVVTTDGTAVVPGSATKTVVTVHEVTPGVGITPLEQVANVTDLGTTGGAVAVPFTVVAPNVKMTANANTTPALTAEREGQKVYFVFTQDGTGGHTIAWGANVFFRGGLNQPDPTAGVTTVFEFYHDGTNFHG